MNSLPAKLKAWRTREGYSRAAAAAYLGTSPRTIEAWEQGLRAPQGMALHFLELIINTEAQTAQTNRTKHRTNKNES